MEYMDHRVCVWFYNIWQIKSATYSIFYGMINVMDKISLGAVDRITRTKIKHQTVQLYLKGKKHAEIVNELNISYDAVSRIIRAYRQNGQLSKEKTRGRKKGEKRTLSAAQEKELQRIIIDKCPDQMMLDFSLWCRAALKQLIHDLYGIDMPLRSVSNYLGRWGMTCQIHPQKYCFPDMQRWKFMTQQYPFLVKWAKKDKAIIYWGAETAINYQQCQFSTRYRNNMLSAVSGRGTCRFMCFWGSMTPQLFIDFLRRLVKDSQGKTVFLFVDIRDIYCGELVRDWVERNKDKIKIFFTDIE